PRIDIGHVSVFRAIAHGAQLDAELEAQLFEALQKKDTPSLRELAKKLDAKTREALLALPDLYGGAEVLDVAEKRLPRLAGPARALGPPPPPAKAGRLPVSLALAELRGYHSHTGVVFAAYCDGARDRSDPASQPASQPVARGGRYDEVGKAFGRARPA